MTAVDMQWPAPDDAATWSALAVVASQHEMLRTDRQFSQEWDRTMVALVTAGLDHDAFTEQRMDALRDWTRRRKLAQRNLRYRFDVRLRRLRLIRRDVKEALSELTP